MKIIYKNIGETPLECISRYSKSEKKTYVGRLDPMAEGLLLMLEGKECIDAEKYRCLDKKYEYEFAVGISTDTYDTLGKITNYKNTYDVSKDVAFTIEDIQGEISMKYPPFSSKTVNGKPLFEYAKNNILDTIDIPINTNTIFGNTHLNTKNTESDKLKLDILKNIKKVNGDFRQNEIIKLWNELPNTHLQIFSMSSHVSSGTYIRAIINLIGKKISMPTIATKINRIKIGEWDSVGVIKK